MKRLSEYIQENKFDILDMKIMNHSYIHYAFVHENLSEYFTFESLGLFKGCKEIVNYVLDLDLNKNYEINSSDIPNLTIKFFDKLILNIGNNKSNNVNGEYEIGYLLDENDIEFEEKRWNKDKSIFNFITINLFNIDNANESEIAEILTHELTHAWDDYILHSK